MTKYRKELNRLCKSIYPGQSAGKKYPQIVIDMVQDDIEELLNSEESVRRDAPSAQAYEIDILIEVMNPALTDTIEVLTKMKEQLELWANDIEWTNTVLGLPKES